MPRRLGSLNRRSVDHCKGDAEAEELHAHLDELTTRIIREAVNDDVGEPLADDPKALPDPNR